MRGQLGLILGMLLTVGLAGYEAPAAEDPSPRMTVTGRVLDPTGKPLPDARVMVYAQAKFRRFLDIEWAYLSAVGPARADGTGQFKVDVPRTSSARHARFGAVALAPGYGANWVELDPDDEPATAEITVRPERVVQGQLLDLQGQPASGVELVITALAPANWGGPRSDGYRSVRFWPPQPKTLEAWPQPVTTDLRGGFTVRGVGRDSLAVFLVRDPRYAQQWIEVKTDGTSDPQRITASLQPARTVTGQVKAADTGQPMAHVRLHIASSSSARRRLLPIYMPDCETDAAGRFRANIGTGEGASAVAVPPAGQPYVGARKRFEWMPGEVAHAVDLALPRGVLVRGKVTEEASKQPVAGALVSFIPQTPLTAADPVEGTIALPLQSETGTDGSFEIAVLPRAGHLIVLGPSDEFISQPIDAAMNSPRRMDAHASVPLDLKLESPRQKLAVTLRRGVTVEVRVVDADGQPVESADMVSGLRASGFYQTPDADREGTVRRGRVRLFGIGPATEHPVYFLEPQHKLGATVQLSATSTPLTARLQPCGKAHARLVDPDKKPVTKPGEGVRRMVAPTMVVTPGLPFYAADANRARASERFVEGVGSGNYPERVAPDAEGRISLPVLIPGATYRIYDFSTYPVERAKLRKEFVARSGEMLDLGDILIEKPPQ